MKEMQLGDDICAAYGLRLTQIQDVVLQLLLTVWVCECVSVWVYEGARWEAAVAVADSCNIAWLLAIVLQLNVAWIGLAESTRFARWKCRWKAICATVDQFVSVEQISTQHDLT